MLWLTLVVLTGCAQRRMAAPPNTPPENMLYGGKLFTSLYQQHAAEYKALCLQSYAWAKLRLDQELVRSTGARPRALVTDIDETVLDNSPYAVHRALLHKDYDLASWMEWTARAEADTVPGAPAFLQYAARQGVEVFYITNRTEAEREATLRNLQRYGLPNADNAHLLLKTTTSGKELRRRQVAASHQILLLVGDNLSDVNDLFDKKEEKQRFEGVDRLAAEWGERYILIPNPNYGDWEGALWNHKYEKDTRYRDSVYRSVLKGY